ncbi:MAG: hypothetical protein ACE3JQ_02700 [Paenisporosarcina sp.]
MKKILLFTVLIGLGFAGGTIMPQVWAESDNSKTEENCNCGCGPVETKVMMVPSGSDMLLTTGLIEAISNDSDNSLTQEELVAIINEIQKENTETNEQMETAVKGSSIELPDRESNATDSVYEELINRFLSLNLSTTTETKNNYGLGNGSEPADGVSSDVKGVDPSNPGKGKNTSTKAVNSSTRTTEVKSSNTSNVKTNTKKTKDTKEKIKNNNGLGNGSEPADGTSTDIKGIDPSNPGNGGSQNNAGQK